MAINLRDSYSKVTWDLGSKKMKAEPWGKTDDTGRGIIVTLAQNSVIVTPTTETLRMSFVKPDGTDGYIGATLEGGKYYIENMSQVFAVPGKVYAELELDDGTEFIKSITFVIEVYESQQSSQIVSSNDYTALQAEVLKINSFASQLADLVYNVKTFKGFDNQFVKGDGVHDDTTGIQTALNYIANGGTLFFPKGTYRCTNTITIPKNQRITIKGVDSNNSVILFDIVGKTEPTPALDCRGTDLERMYLSIKDIQFQGTQTPNINGIWTDYLHENTFENVKTILFGLHGIKVDIAINLTFLNCISKYNGGDGIHFTAGPYHNICQIIGGIYISNTGNGIYYSSGNNVAIIKPTAELNGGYGIYLKSIKGGSILSPYTEANILNQIYLDTCTGITLDGINISSGAANNTFIKVKLSNGIVFNGFSIKLYGLLAGTLAMDIQDSTVIFNAPWVEDCAKGFYFKNAVFTLNAPIFVNTTVPIETYNHTSVKGRIDLISQSDIDKSVFFYAVNKLVIATTDGTFKYYNLNQTVDNGDITLNTKAKGIVLKDRTTSTAYRLLINNGVLSIEPA